MTDLVIWHNPRCSKSRETLALLRAHGFDPTIVPYLTQPPNEQELRTALFRLNLKAIEIMRRKEKRFTELGFGQDSPENDLIAAMVENPVLIERPIVFKGSKAAIGRPPEAVLAIV